MYISVVGWFNSKHVLQINIIAGLGPAFFRNTAELCEKSNNNKNKQKSLELTRLNSVLLYFYMYIITDSTLFGRMKNKILFI